MDDPPSFPPTPPPPSRNALQGFAIAATCTAAMIVNNANNTSVAIALPSIGMDLRARATTLQWLVSAYALSSGCLLVFFGHIADVHGRKRVFVGGSVILAAFTLACGFAQNQNAMIVLRTLQGVGGAATIPAAIGILAHNFPPSAGRAHAIAFASLAAGGPLGAALGMVLGGLLTQLASDTWRAQFFLTAGLTLLTLIAGVFFFPNDASPSLLSSTDAHPPPAPSTPRPSATATDADADVEDGTGKYTYPPPPSPSSLPTPTPLLRRKSNSASAKRQKTDWIGVFLSTTGLVLLAFSLGQGAGPGPPPPMRSEDPAPQTGGGWAELGIRGDVCGRGGPRELRRRKVKRDEMWTAQVALGVGSPEEEDVEPGFEDEEVEVLVEFKPYHPQLHWEPPPPRYDLMRWLFAVPHPHPPPPRRPPLPPPRFGHPGHSPSHELVEMLDLVSDSVTEGVDLDFKQCPPPPPPPQSRVLRWLFVDTPPPPRHRHGHRMVDEEDGNGAWMGGGDAWGMPYIITLLALSIVLLGLFAAWEIYLSRPRSSRMKHSFLAWAEVPPLLPPALFGRGRGRVGAMYVVALLQFGAFMTWAFWVQLYYQIYIGLTPVGTVVKLIPMFVTGILCNLFVAVIAWRVPTGWLLTVGTLTTSIAPLLFALVNPSATYWAFGFPAAVCVVVGADFLFSSGMMFVAASVRPDEQSVAGGVFQTMTQLGTSFGVTASTIVFNHVQQQAERTGADALESYHAAMWTGVAFGGLAAIFAFVAFWGVRVQPPGPPPASAENRAGNAEAMAGAEARDCGAAQALEKRGAEREGVDRKV